jgi:hypothetical protein
MQSKNDGVVKSPNIVIPVAVYSSPDKLNDANTRMEEKLVVEHLFEF